MKLSYNFYLSFLREINDMYSLGSSVSNTFYDHIAASIIVHNEVQQTDYAPVLENDVVVIRMLANLAL